MIRDQKSIDLGNLLLSGLHRGYADLLAEVRALDDTAGNALIAETGWSVRDHVAHLSAWEAVELARAEGRPGLREQLNIVWEAAWRGRHRASVVEALEVFANVHRRLIAVLTDTPDAILHRPWHPAYPDSLAANIARNTYRHYTEHLAVLRRFAGSACAAP
ncbi:MAG: ClbS/DfsB family four-helix bundle protein [Candidatus Dormibacteraeota bacterium]|nr:ClbS/DfsB family four-helix bundle protein [Candidatus Dormibacteraeota bacterium]